MHPSGKLQQDRQAQRRLALLRHAEEVMGHVSLTCRRYGISRNCFYKWERRYVCLRQNHHFGPMKIKMRLGRYHGIDAEEFYRMLAGIVIDDTGVPIRRPHGSLAGPRRCGVDSPFPWDVGGLR
ncbi:hypothetical protein [Streptomyces caeruleatus]|uniref:Transposase n=1 Tax=Streptomyces caeruleatus TaxID=661399 RepID=A0A101U7N6_9ACTN|nr:hypothetical protein [Streptomyces caeruleatus]KUO05519.1 hypothetical protein AQJ67_05045 [Streptomyces caeruleatus]